MLLVTLVEGAESVICSPPLGGVVDGLVEGAESVICSPPGRDPITTVNIIVDVIGVNLIIEILPLMTKLIINKY